jgi:chorismate mutase
MKKYEYLLVKTASLPEVFERVIYAKELLSSGQVSNVSAAVKKAEISRSAFYKYRNDVFAFDGKESNKIINLEAVLDDRAGVFSALTEKLYRLGVNLLTINQHHPIDNKANVSLSVRLDNSSLALEDLIREIRKTQGVITINII